MNKNNHFGDLGNTSDFNHNPIPKNSRLINALGNLDELIAYLGLIRIILPKNNHLPKIQQQLQAFSAYISGFPSLESFYQVADLEQEIAIMEQNTPPQTSFYLPGEREIPTFINLARTICRRTERFVVHLEPKYPIIIQFLNRLSDYLFALQIFHHYQSK